MAKQKKQKGGSTGRGKKKESEERDETLAQMSTPELLEHLVSLGLNVSKDLALEITKREDALFYLRKMLQDGKYWYQDGPGDGWAPIHAIHILALINTMDALELLRDILRYRGEDLGDWLTEDMPTLLAAFGDDAIEQLKAFAGDETLESLVRGAATTALNVIAHRNPARREEIVNHFRLLLQDTTDRLFGTLLIGELLSFRDPSVLDLVYAAFDAGWVDTSFICREEVEEILNAPEKEQEYMIFMKKNPLKHFSPENIDRLTQINYPEEEK